MDFTVTESAWKRIREVLPQSTWGEDPSQKVVLRIKVVGGGCSGLHYEFKPDTLRSGDLKIEKDEYVVVIDPKSFLYVKGSELDYIESLAKSEFVIQNPNAKSSCGCGKSFST